MKIPWSDDIQGLQSDGAMLSRSQNLGPMCRLCSVVCRRLCDKADKSPEFMETWSEKPTRSKLNEESAELIRSCIKKNRRYQNSIVMENFGRHEIYLNTKKNLDLAFLTQDSTKQHLYRRMNSDIITRRKDFPLPLKEYYRGAMGIEHLEEWDPVLVVGIAHRTSLSNLSWMAHKSTGMLSLKNVELFILMTGDDVIIPKTSVDPKLVPFRGAGDLCFTREYKMCDEYVTADSRDNNYLVHFVINNDFNLKEDYLEFFALVSLLRAPEVNVIRKLESAFPGSGLPLIKAGYTMTHKVKQLTPEQYFDIFKIIRKVDTYKNVTEMEEENYHVQQT
ncbi:uncharacterized protein LOC110453457 isoform X2 [Mizuhopecten yessoensis]|uniref:uncharacterized protein LOC110453457 isoform X2 n=1 Tax=Mizuhopecten yessoensis TaxID=6573 RepID=UPI000B45C0DF|nr:uncharacterized protein LOC110453457 isoform X2 [Mizuhopecten yessoensis]